MEIAIELKNLSKTFDGKHFVLNNINLRIAKGSLTAIIGFSGTGKSVIIKHMMGLIKPTSGEVWVLGQPVNELKDEELTALRKKFGVLFQFAALFDDMTVLENVCFPLVEHRKDLSPKQIIEIAANKLRQVGLDEIHFHKLPSEISGGMQKRTGLARALALNPEIIFYDEPTTGLDPILTRMVHELIEQTHRSQPGLTSVMISHDLEGAFTIADKIIMLHKGQVLLEGPPKVFFESDNSVVKEFLSKGYRKNESV